MSMGPIEFAERLLAYCAATSGSVTSWGRTKVHNHDVGGVANSQHLSWTAADVVFDGQPIYPDDQRRQFALRYGLKLIVENDHDHLQAM